MGSLFSSILSPNDLVDDVRRFIAGRKRKRHRLDSSCEDEEEDVGRVIDLAMHTPKRKKLATTAKYIYQTLYEEGKNSDIRVSALGHQFHLHKIYLCQSPYFASMFGGDWLEYNKRHVDIDIIDPEITFESLRVVFGSLYNDEITLNAAEIVPIMACATMFQLDTVIDKCREVMVETINQKSAIRYYSAACRYADKRLEDTCVKWFLVNLMTFYYHGSIRYLQTIPVALMTKLVAHPDLFVVQTEFSVYVMLKFWMYMLCCCVVGRTPPIGGVGVAAVVDEDPTVKEINAFYCAQSASGGGPFLYKKDGLRFVATFESLRIEHLLTHHADVEAISRDNIIPTSWLNATVMRQWRATLKVNQNEDRGPPHDLPHEIFHAKSLRCGRVLNERDSHTWRWTGFHYGVDFLMTANGTTLSIKRNHRPEFEQLLSLQATRRVAVRATVATLNKQRQVQHQQSTGLKVIPLTKNEEVTLLTFDKDVDYPLIVSVNVLFTSSYDEARESHDSGATEVAR